MLIGTGLSFVLEIPLPLKGFVIMSTVIYQNLVLLYYSYNIANILHNEIEVFPAQGAKPPNILMSFCIV